MGRRSGIRKVTPIACSRPTIPPRQGRRVHRTPRLLGRASLGVALLSGCTPPPQGAVDTDDAEVTDDTAPSELPLFDAHIHLLGSQQDDELVDYATRGDLSGMAVLGPKSAFSLQQSDPDHIVAFVFVEDAADPGVVAEVESALERGARGVGELSIRHFPSELNPDGVELDATGETLLAIYDLAARYDVPLNIHFDYSSEHIEELGAALAHDRDVRFIWAHSGDAQPEEVRAVLDAHPNLWADLSCRNPYYTRSDIPVDEQSISGEDEDSLDEAWSSLLTDHSDRFLFGTDIGPSGRADQLEETVAFFRTMLLQLEPDDALAIGHDNAVRLFGLGPSTR